MQTHEEQRQKLKKDIDAERRNKSVLFEMRLENGSSSKKPSKAHERTQ